MMDDHQRDMFGNRTPSNLSPVEAQTAGALPTDTSDDIQWKVNNHRILNARAGSATAPGAGRAMVKAFVVLALACILVNVAAFTQPWWKYLASPSMAWEHFQASRSVDERREKFSDFSALADWPREVRASVARRAHLTPTELVARLPTKGMLSDAQRREFGAAMWFAVSASGSDARTMYRSFQAKMASKSPDTQFLAMNFLDQKCESGLEVACLDLAKALAGGVFRQEYTSADRQMAIRAALAQLPATGPMAASPAVIALKRRLAAYQ